MKQLLQDARTGQVAVAEVPAPKLLAGCVLVRTAVSLVSAGTERASSEFAKKSLLQKARMRPDLVRDVLSKISRDGLVAAAAAVRSRLDQPNSLGYSSAGVVVSVGEGVTDIQLGDRVACAGVGHAVHAEFARVPRLLVARLPSDEVTFDQAAFTTVGSVAIHGVRTADVRLGDIVAVIGLGLLGQLTVQVLKAAGCRVLGMDISPERAELASHLGADATTHSPSMFRDLCLQYSSGRGADAVLIAAQTASNDPVNLAGDVARDRAAIVAVGTVGMDIPRRVFYQKELDFRVSRSCGPGRYDSLYEQKGLDYPIGYVRWTETRNMEAFLTLIAEGKLRLSQLITHRFAIERAPSAYELIMGQSNQPFLGVLIDYPGNATQNTQVAVASGRIMAGAKHVGIGLLGAGSFATSTLLPAIKSIGGVEFVTACAASGTHARHAAEKFGFRNCTTDEREIYDDPAISTVVISTRHHLHAGQVIAAIKAGKHVFCEKPLCLNEEELREISATRDAQTSCPHFLMVGFNRRFSPFALRMKNFLEDAHEPLALHYRVNAGLLPAEHWLNDPGQGGGRIIGEVCHFVDFLSFLTGAAPVEVETRALPNLGPYSNDNVVCSLRFSDGSHGTISYLANGDKSYSKERVEVFGGGSIAVLDDFRSLELTRRGKKNTFRSRWHRDKGHRGEWAAFVEAVRTGAEAPIPFRGVVSTMRASFALEQSRCLGRPVAVALVESDGSSSAPRSLGRVS